MNFENTEWFVHPDKVRTDYPVIENISQFYAPTPPQLPKYHPQYIKYWSKEFQKCIEGIWRKEFGQWRYMTGSMYFYINFGVIQHTIKEVGVDKTKFMKPIAADYVWENRYYSWCAYGFSGFEKDTEFNCHRKLEDFYKDQCSLEDLPEECLHNGQPKKFVDPFEYIKGLHKHKLGKSLFGNTPLNKDTMGSRGGGKSYEVAIAELEYNYIFSGSRRFDEDFVNNTLSCFQVIGAADTSKSADCLAKFKKSQDAKLDASNADFKKWFGIIEEFDSEGNSTITPCPFYKRSLGTLECPNKRKPYTSRYKAEINGEWKERGVDNRIYHVNYSTKKGDGAQAAVGERYLYSDVEEQGLVENLVEIHGSNEPATKRGAKVGIQDFQGTSGNIEYVQSAKKVWLNPRDYFIYPLRNKFTTDGANGEAGVFLPRYMLNFEFKDANGNTDYKKAIDSVNKERIEAAKSKDPSVLRNLLINEPCYPHEMWMHTSGYYLPYEEAAERERELMKGQMYKTLGTPVVFKWDEKVAKGVSYDVAHNVEPIYDFPIPKELKDPSGCAVIYEQPIDNPPKDFYLFCCDPYVEEDIDKGGSLAVTYVIKNPKYIALGYAGHFIVASYIGKPSKGLGYYYEQQEKLIQYYGNFPQSFWYDARGGGETLRDYYIRKGKQYILCLRPNHTKGDAMYERHTTTHGVVIGNRDSKKTVLKLANDKLLETNVVMENGEEKIRRNIFRIPCIFLIRQIMQYNLDDNFDAVSSFYIGILGLNETEAKIEKAVKNQRKVNIFESLLKNENIFKQTHSWVQ